MTNINKQKISKNLIALCAIFGLAVFLAYNYSIAYAQYSDYSSYSSDYSSDYSSYSPSYSSDYSSYSPSYTSNYSSYSSGDTSNYSNYTPSTVSSYSTYTPSYTSNYSSYSSSDTSNYSSYTPSYSSDYSSYTPSYTSNYSSYTPSDTSNYSTYTPSNTSNYSTYTPTSNYSTYTPTSNYSTYTPVSDYTTYSPVYSYDSYVSTPSYTYTPSYSIYTPYTYTYTPTTYTTNTYIPTYVPVTPVVTPVQPQPSTLSGTCSPDRSSANIGDNVVWSGTGVMGGVGNYTYSWSGTDGISGNSPSISKVYSTSGVKNATLTITSGNQSITRNCSMQVVTPAPVYNPINASCVASNTNVNTGDTIVWSATGISGGNGTFSYSWSGTDGLSGSGTSVSQSYNYSGTKTANLTVSSNGQSITVNCNAYVNVAYVPIYNPPTYNPPVYNPPVYNPPVYNAPTYNPPVYNYPTYNSLDASCVANQSSAYVNDGVSWSAINVSGGNGNYTYSWTGTDGLYNTGQYVYKSYGYAGTKYAYLTVYSNGQSITRTCSVYVNNRYNPVITYTNPVIPYNYNGVSLSQVPYTGLDSNMKVILFTLSLAVWSAIVTYVIILRKKNNQSEEMVPVTAHNTISLDQSSATSYGFTDDLASYARTKNVIISTDALQSIANVSGGSVRKAQSLINSLASRFSTGDEYTTLDLEKVQSAIG